MKNEREIPLTKINSKSFNVIKTMEKNRKMNKGQPIIAIVYKINDYDNPLYMESNKPAKKEYDEYGNEIYDDNSIKFHAEALILEQMKNKFIDGKGLTIYITTSPCDNCAKLLEELKFDKVIYLFEKFEKNNHKEIYFRQLDNVYKYNKNDTKRERKSLQKMENNWSISNKSNLKKTKNKSNKTKFNYKYDRNVTKLNDLVCRKNTS